MRFYPDSDVFFYVDIPDGWDRYCQWPKKNWKYKDLSPSPAINYWRDLEGAKKKEVLKTDLYFDDWMRTRLNENSCLPILYSTGNRFIRITKAFPAGFKCAPMPMNLIEAREMRAKIKEELKNAKKNSKKDKKINKRKFTHNKASNSDNIVTN